MRSAIRLCAGLATTAVIAAVFAGAATSTRADVWSKLHRRLHIPRIESGASCPATSQAALAKSAVRPRVQAGDTHLVLRLDLPSRRSSVYYGSPWGGQNVMWEVRASYRGPVLMRGRQLDGRHDVRFERGQIPVRERRFQKSSASTGAQRLYSSVTRIGAPGCYAFQVDGLGFSRVVVFEVKANGPANAEEAVDALKARGLPMQPSGSFRSLAFDYLLDGLQGQRFQNPGGEIVLWRFPTFDAVHILLIRDRGTSLVAPLQPSGAVSAAIFCLVDPASEQPCSYVDVRPPHWYRSGTALALYLGTDRAMLETMENVLGEQFAGV